MLAHEVIGRLAAENHHGIIVAQQARGGHRARRNAVGAMQPQDLLHQIDGAIEVAAPTGNRHGPLRLSFGGQFLPDDRQLERGKG